MRYRYSFKLIGFGKYERVKEEIKEPRSPGSYWVKYLDSEAWTVAEWDGSNWHALHDSASLKDYNFELIHEEKVIPPQY